MTRHGRIIAGICIDAAVLVTIALVAPVPTVVALAVTPLVFAACVALHLDRRRPWEPEALPPEPTPAALQPSEEP